MAVDASRRHHRPRIEVLPCGKKQSRLFGRRTIGQILHRNGLKYTTLSIFVRFFSSNHKFLKRRSHRPLLGDKVAESPPAFGTSNADPDSSTVSLANPESRAHLFQRASRRGLGVTIFCFKPEAPRTGPKNLLSQFAKPLSPVRLTMVWWNCVSVCVLLVAVA